MRLLNTPQVELNALQTILNGPNNDDEVKFQHFNIA
jgi:hypothetical protein